MNRRGLFRAIPSAVAAAVVAPEAIAKVVQEFSAVRVGSATGRFAPTITPLRNPFYDQGYYDRHIQHVLANKRAYVDEFTKRNPLFDELRWVEADWHPGMPQQAESRCHRIGPPPVVEVICFAP